MKSNTSPKVNVKDERSSVFEAANKKNQIFFIGPLQLQLR
jgi:hypothetical protein